MLPKRSTRFMALTIRYVSIHAACALVFVAGAAQANPTYYMSDFESSPIVIDENSATPVALLNASNDHQLFFKAYNDYSDLDGDGSPDTTYKHSFDYYGYFDSYKCYVYRNNRFEPEVVTNDKYCSIDPADGQWSGNFLNWASMSRIDTIRKILFGGHRRVDENNDTGNGETVLERSYLPHDAHSWAKHYAGDDLEKLVPFEPGSGQDNYICDQGNPNDCSSDEEMGITIGNTTDVDMSLYNNKYSEEYNEPPLIKVVKGNHSLWASNERWQITWRSGAPFDNHAATNANNSANSQIFAYNNNPTWSERLGEGNYNARVLACVNQKDTNGASLIGQEKCKLYPGADQAYGLNRGDFITILDPNFDDDDVAKPIGLLQTYGDEDEMEFGMIAGSYLKHASGGVLIRNIGSMSDEINVDTDGIFKNVAQFAGGPQSNNSSYGLINAWSLYRLVGYNGDTGTYNDSQGDDCIWGLSDFSDVTKSNRCKNWGNPFSEIYYQSINYFSGGGVIGDYRSNSSTGIPGLPVPQNFTDPLNFDNRCAPLNVINLNSSVFSYDYDELDSQSYGPHTVWDPAVLPGSGTTSDMTNSVGTLEGLYQSGANSYFIGESAVGTGNDQICSAKTVSNLGEVAGVCPEAPRLGGSYRIAGLAYYAHVNDIRPDTATGNRNLEGQQFVDTYSVALAANAPALKIPDPNNPTSTVATIIPACRNQSLSPEGNCAIVDYKIVDQTVSAASNTASGTLYINWEDSEQGGDYDQDMWGTMDYSLNTTTKVFTITTDVHADSTPYKMGFGYIVSGTTDDGFHAHSGIDGYTKTESVSIGNSCINGCTTADPASTKTYTLGQSSAQLLKDPLWYAAKYGGFKDKNFNNQPDRVDEWDERINATGALGSDGIPDNYFYAENPRQLEASLKAALDAILERTSSGTAAAVVSSNVRGEGALFQAYFRPRIKDDNDDIANWVGTLQALWLDKYGLSRQDCSPPYGYDAANDECVPPTGTCVPNGQLDNYCVDQVTETYFDEVQERTRVKVYQSSSPNTFEAYSMEGVVTAYNSGQVTMEPNTLEGNATYNSSNNTLTISPYQVQGTVTAYDPATGGVTISIASNAWDGPAGQSFDQWRVTTSAGPAIGFSDDAITLAADPAVALTLSPAGTWVSIGDVLTFSTHNVIGETGKSFSNWHVECLDGITQTADIGGATIKMQNSEDITLLIDSTSNDFTGCNRAEIATYNLQGDAGDSYSIWNVTNLNTILGRGKSNDSITLSNYGTKVYNVSPTSNWLNPGERVRVSNFTSTSHEINDISYIWNAREELYLDSLNDTTLGLNRTYSATTETAADKRFIKTWVDHNQNGIVDSGEYIDFVEGMFDYTTNPVPYGLFDVGSKAEAKDVVQYVRGIEVPGTRSRTAKFDANETTAHVMRLGDIINSTPTVVPAPMEAFDLLYKDNTYGEFRRQYLNRRIMVYAGANDGLLHAFNGGFYTVADEDGHTLDQYDNVLDKTDCHDRGDKTNYNAGAGFAAQTVKYSKCGYDTTIGESAPAAQHPLGSEVWAYAPMNLLSHLQWLKDPDYQYSHVAYVDGKPRVFDAKIFPVDADHPHGWGTVLVVSMNLGGGLMEVDVNSDDTGGNANTGDNLNLRSAYVVFDVTNPEKEPQLLAEIPMPDNSFTTVYPAVVAFQDTTGTNCNGNTSCNRWYLQFGTGPNNMTNYTSDQTAKMFLFDLEQLFTGTPSALVNSDVPASCTIETVNYSPTVSPYNVIQCDTSVADTFMGTPVVVDWDLDFFADTSYFGLVGDHVADEGRIIRMAFTNQEDTKNWDDMHTFYTTDQPITVQIAPGIDDLDNKWLYFGTGRFFADGDKTSTTTQSLYGIKDDEIGSPVDPALILDTSSADVYSSGDLVTDIVALDGSTLSSFSDIEYEIDNNAIGWKIDLPDIISGGPATRNLTKSALFGGVLFSSVFQPSQDPCEGEGNSRLYGLYYKTGTAFPNPSTLGSDIVDDAGTIKYLSKKYIDLGRGFATAPAIHSGSGSGGDDVRVLTQLSTGDIVSKKADPVFNVRTGRTSWGDN